MKATLPHFCAALFLGLSAIASAQDDHNHSHEGGQRQGGGPGQGQGGPGGPGQGGPGGMLARNPITKALDKDGNGELSAEEIAGASAALITLDKDGDGKLSGEEIRPVRQQRGPTPQQAAHELMETLDKNKDGKVTADELPERLKAMIERQDANKDGALTEDELIKANEKTPEPAARPAEEAEKKPGV